MCGNFFDKIRNNEYISNYLYTEVMKNNPENVPKDFDLETYNKKFVDTEYEKNKDYFDKMYSGIDNSIHLDKEQINAIISDEDYSLVIAGAGTGKTTIVASKVKYLVDIKSVNPAKILVMSYTKKSTLELEKRICIDFNIPANVTTFHSLGYSYLRDIFKNHKCYVVDSNIRREIFLEYFKNKIFPYKNKLKEIFDIFTINNTNMNTNFMFGNFLKENYDKYSSFDEYFSDYKKYKYSKVKDIYNEINDILDRKNNAEIIYTIKGEMVKSKGEAIIANYLFINGIDYVYEKVYDELMPNRKIYKPDFTLNLYGEKVYIEYFGLSNYKNDEMQRYNKIKNIKEKYHKEHGTKFIKIDYEPNENIIYKLRLSLIEMGFELRHKSAKEIYNAILDSNKLAEVYPFEKFLYNEIDIIKSSSKREEYANIVNSYIQTLSSNEAYDAKRQLYYIDDFYRFYQKKLFGAELYGFDYGDMLYYSNKFIDNIGNSNHSFEYIIVDEYQDISFQRYSFIKHIIDKNKCKIMAVGDDWQAIYGFSGSKVEYTYDFSKYFEGAKLFKISNTYRNSNQLIDISGTFIMKNEMQIKKELKSLKNVAYPVKIVNYEEDEIDILKQLILYIHKNNPNHSILILGRKNTDIKSLFDDPLLKDDIDSKIQFVGYEDIDINAMTIHKSKGLSSDEVIITGLNNGFPSDDRKSFWLSSLFKFHPIEELIPFAEERRIFYVALTRTKNNVYLLKCNDARKRSEFIDEIENIIKKINN